MSPKLPRILVLATLVTSGVVSGTASAAPSSSLQAADPAVHAHADELFRAGRTAASAGDNKTACERFTASENLEPAPGTQLNLGACEEAQGHLLGAREHFRLAVMAFRPDDRRRPLAEARAADLSRRLAHLTVHLAPGVPADVRVAVAGAQFDATILEHSIEVDPGRTTLAVSAGGRQPRTYEVTLKEGESRELEVNVGDSEVASASAVTTREPLPHSSRFLRRTLGFVGAGVGAASLVTGAVFGGLALHEASVVKANCSPTFACKPAGVSAASSGQTDSVISTASLIAGGIFAATGVYLLVTTWKKPSHPKAVTLTPMLPRSGFGLVTAFAF